MTNKYKKITEWLSENYEPLNDWIYFNASIYEDGNTSLNTLESERALNEFTDGSREVELLFAISMIRLYDNSMSDTNLMAINEVEHFMDWLENTNTLPNLGEFYTTNSFDVLDSNPSVAVDNEQNLAKYQFNCSINYLERSQQKWQMQ